MAAVSSQIAAGTDEIDAAAASKPDRVPNKKLKKKKTKQKRKQTVRGKQRCDSVELGKV